MSKIDLSLKDAFRRARDKVESYGVRVYIGDVKDPNTGIFDGSEIGVDYANDLEMSLLVLVHLFGHTVQWNTVPSYRTIATRVKPGAAPEVIEEARVYEENASRYGLQLLHEAGIADRVSGSAIGAAAIGSTCRRIMRRASCRIGPSAARRGIRASSR